MGFMPTMLKVKKVNKKNIKSIICVLDCKIIFRQWLQLKYTVTNISGVHINFTNLSDVTKFSNFSFNHKYLKKKILIKTGKINNITIDRSRTIIPPNFEGIDRSIA